MKKELIPSKPVYEYECEVCGKKNKNKMAILQCEEFCTKYAGCSHEWKYDSFCDQQDGNLNVDRTCSICEKTEMKEIFPGNLPDKLLEIIFGYLDMPEKERCSNSMTGEHKWSENCEKNKGKPTACVYCGKFKDE